MQRWTRDWQEDGRDQGSLFDTQDCRACSTSRINGSTILSASESWARLNHSFRYLQHITAPKVYNSPWSTHFAHTAFLQSDSAVPDEARKFIPEPVYPASRFEASPDLKSAAQRFDVPSWLSIITSAQGITDLRNLQQNSARRSTINLHNLQSYRLDAADSFDFGYRKMTIEFRQHAGTLQSQETLSWLRVLASLFQYAHDNREPDIPKLCLNNWADPSMDSIDFLMMVGVDAGTIKHYEHVLGVSVSQTYADCIRREEQAAVSRDSWDQYLTPVALELIETRTAGISPWNVTSVIREKFARGGYGQFPACYLADMRLHKAAVDILTVGTRPSWATLPSRDSAIDLRASLFDSVRK
ncbi:uncharacterized protein MYCGRDRAFT_96634 [Zymoseptoria tritici IPO323]|uniref:Uncharacterized protein n=1 Tax=Zymoseptoria tritici (strain CBS 115943 / IPO323) TaxID=336722 RepID=F9XN06_ZYMTI|nr:uncharacterized protein MYCGRDRAFT_96634 [Zymoseptoria tritici IPO323]EGP83330.1 hypothetical protein MYCGRDRAFT_96634 [Zymoseptoria tritici IPO323]